ncbi:MAG: hypothetical protein HC880_13480 [Bacteroidia bacterium]|nr:hypothetical protein [Bacteroidia bacterium]
MRRSRREQMPETARLEGKIYIRAEDYAIVKFEYVMHIREKERWKKFSELRLEYQEFQGKLYLHYISFGNQIVIRSDNNEPNTYFHWRELFVNKLRTENLPAPDTFYLFSRIQEIFDQSTLGNPAFWDHYNMVIKKADR